MYYAKFLDRNEINSEVKRNTGEIISTKTDKKLKKILNLVLKLISLHSASVAARSVNVHVDGHVHFV